MADAPGNASLKLCALVAKGVPMAKAREMLGVDLAIVGGEDAPAPAAAAMAKTEPEPEVEPAPEPEAVAPPPPPAPDDDSSDDAE